MKNFKKAFTLTELLVALGVIAVLCAILIPIITNIMPNQKTIMAKRAFYTAQSIVSELINDEACYPDKTQATTDMRFGFDDYKGYPNCTTTKRQTGISGDQNCPTSYEGGWNGEYYINALCSNEKKAAAAKFVNLFADRLGKEISEDPFNGYPNFSTSDGMKWMFLTGASYFQTTEPSGNGGAQVQGVTFKPTSDDLKVGGALFLLVDVNGSEGPNCGKSTNTGYMTPNGVHGCRDATSGFDRFVIAIRGNGQIYIHPDDTWAIDAVKVDKNITDD